MPQQRPSRLLILRRSLTLARLRAALADCHAKLLEQGIVLGRDRGDQLLKRSETRHIAALDFAVCCGGCLQVRDAMLGQRGPVALVKLELFLIELGHGF